jgi:hypothetical protein
MKIPHLTRDGSFRPQLRAAIATLTDSDAIQVTLSTGGGYNGSIQVRIGPRAEAEFEAAVELADPSRFPARIRAACTELRDQGCSGTFQVTHEDGILTISRL